MNKYKDDELMGLLKRLIFSMIVIGLTAFFVPGMRNRGGLLNLALVAVVIAFLQHYLVKFFGSSQKAKGSTGFLVMAISLYLAGKLIGKFDVNLFGAIIGGLVYGLVDSMIPGEKLH